MTSIDLTLDWARMPIPEELWIRLEALLPTPAAWQEPPGPSAWDDLPDHLLEHFTS